MRSSRLLSPALAHCWQAALMRSSSCGRINDSNGASIPAWAAVGVAVSSSALPRVPAAAPSLRLP